MNPLCCCSLNNVQVHHPAVIPVCGSDPLAKEGGGLSCAMQLYHCPASQLAVLQLRYSSLLY